MVKDFTKISAIMKRYNKIVSKFDDMKLKKFDVKDHIEEEDVSILVSPNGTSIAYTDKTLAMFMSGTHSLIPEEWDPQLQVIHRGKMLLAMNALLEAIGLREFDRIPLMQQLLQENNGFLETRKITLGKLQVSVIPNSNVLQMYVTIKED